MRRLDCTGESLPMFAKLCHGSRLTEMRGRRNRSSGTLRGRCDANSVDEARTTLGILEREIRRP